MSQSPVTKLLVMSHPHFADRLIKAIRAKNTALMVGIDPRWDQLPESLRENIDEKDRTAVANGFERFSCEIIDVVAGLVPAIKPQAAFFEMCGPAGMVALANVIDHARLRELLVILDGKRNDIGSTAEAYARSYLGAKPDSAWGCDALTVNPYLGVDSLQPFIARAQQTGSGVFALVKTSNPESKTFQELELAGDGRVYQSVGRWIQHAASQTTGEFGYGIIGAVVGATYPDQLAQLRSELPNVFFLVPGFGAQGGTAADIAGAFDSHGLGAIINSSRQIIFAFNEPRFAQKNWHDSIEKATLESIQQLADLNV